MSDSRLVTETPHAARGYILAFSCIVLVYRSLGSMIALAPGAAAGVRIVLARRRAGAELTRFRPLRPRNEERRPQARRRTRHGTRACCVSFYSHDAFAYIRHESVTAPPDRRAPQPTFETCALWATDTAGGGTDRRCGVFVSRRRQTLVCPALRRRRASPVAATPARCGPARTVCPGVAG